MVNDDEELVQDYEFVFDKIAIKESLEPAVLRPEENKEDSQIISNNNEIIR